MHLFRSNQPANIIWRFYMNQNQAWHWQRLSLDRSVVEESDTGYANYAQCVASAARRGYTFRNAPPSTRWDVSTGVRHWSFER